LNVSKLETFFRSFPHTNIGQQCSPDQFQMLSYAAFENSIGVPLEFGLQQAGSAFTGGLDFAGTGWVSFGVNNFWQLGYKHVRGIQKCCTCMLGVGANDTANAPSVHCGPHYSTTSACPTKFDLTCRLHQFEMLPGVYGLVRMGWLVRILHASPAKSGEWAAHTNASAQPTAPEWAPLSGFSVASLDNKLQGFATLPPTLSSAGLRLLPANMTAPFRWKKLDYVRPGGGYFLSGPYSIT
jgi:hypothetical protein